MTLRLAIPVLRVSDSRAAEQLYCSLLGFEREFAYRPDPAHSDPCYLGVQRDGVMLHLSSFSGDAVPGGVAMILVDDLDALHAELLSRGVAIDLPPTDQSWGNREMYVKDADGNCLRFTQSNYRSSDNVL